jgi:WD40 repeat protein
MSITFHGRQSTTRAPPFTAVRAVVETTIVHECASSSADGKPPTPPKCAVWAMAWNRAGDLLAVAGGSARQGTLTVHERPPWRGGGGESGESGEATPLSVFCAGSDDEPPPPPLDPTPLVVFLDHAKPIVAVSWSRKGDFLLSASLDSSVRLYKPRRSRACLFTFAHLKPLTSVAFCPWNDMHFVTGGLDRKLRLWDVSKGKVEREVECPDEITALACSPDRDIAAGMTNGEVAVWTSDLKRRIIVRCRNRNGQHRDGRKVTRVVFDRTAARFLVTTKDSRIRLVRKSDWRVIYKFKADTADFLGELFIGASFSPDERYVICGSRVGAVYVWDCPIGAEDAASGGGSAEMQKSKGCLSFMNCRSRVRAGSGRSDGGGGRGRSDAVEREGRAGGGGAPPPIPSRSDRPRGGSDDVSTIPVATTVALFYPGGAGVGGGATPALVVTGDKDGALRVFRVGREGDFDDSGGGVSPGSDGAADSGGGGGGGGLSHLFGRLFRDVDS